MSRSLTALLSSLFVTEDRETRELRAYARRELKADARLIVWKCLDTR